MTPAEASFEVTTDHYWCKNNLRERESYLLHELYNINIASAMSFSVVANYNRQLQLQRPILL